MLHKTKINFLIFAALLINFNITEHLHAGKTCSAEQQDREVIEQEIIEHEVASFLTRTFPTELLNMICAYLPCENPHTTTLQKNRGWLSNVKFLIENRDGKLIVNNSNSDGLDIIDPKNPHAPRRKSDICERHIIACAAQLPDGSIVTGGHSHNFDGEPPYNTLILWHNSGDHIFLNYHPKTVLCCLALPEGNIVTGSSDGSVNKCNLKTKDRASLRKADDCAVESLAYSPHGYLGIGYADGGVQISQLCFPWSLVTNYGHRKAVKKLAFMHDGKLLSGSECGKICLCDPKDVGRMQELYNEKSAIKALGVLPNGRLVSAAGNKIKIWNITQSEPTTKGISWTYEAISLPKEIACLALLSDGNLAIGTSNDEVIKLELPALTGLQRALKRYIKESSAQDKDRLNSKS